MCPCHLPLQCPGRATLTMQISLGWPGAHAESTSCSPTATPCIRAAVSNSSVVSVNVSAMQGSAGRTLQLLESRRPQPSILLPWRLSEIQVEPGVRRESPVGLMMIISTSILSMCPQSPEPLALEQQNYRHSRWYVFLMASIAQECT